MAQVLILLFMLSLAAWIHAERRLSFAARVGSGILALLLGGLNVYVVATMGPMFERTFHRNSMRLAGELIAKGQTQRVAQAIETYNGVAATESTYRAAMQMWKVLNHGPKE